MKSLFAFIVLAALSAAQTSPDLAAVLSKGAELVSTNQLSASQELYVKALRDFPDDPDLHFELGMVFFRQHDWPHAVENFKSTLKSRPKSIKPLFYLAETYFLESDLDLARQTIAQAASIAPNDAQVCQKYGEYLSATVETRKQGLSWLEKARTLNPNLMRIDFDIGKTQFALTDYESAASSFEMAVKKDARDGEAAFDLAESWARLGDWGKARDSYASALARGYTTGSAYYGQGRAELELGNSDAAVGPLQRALVVQPSLIAAHFQLAKAYRQLHRIKEAKDETRLFAAMTDRVDTSRELDPDEEQACKQVKPLLEANKESEALNLLDALAVAAQPDDEPHYLVGVMYYSMGRRDDAKRILKIARSKAPKSARIAAYLGMLQLSGGEEAAAEHSFESALSLDSTDAIALIGMGGIRYRQRRWSDAISYLDRSRTADPDTLFLLCDAYYRVQDPDQATLIAQVIRALGANRKPLLDKLERLEMLHKADQPHPTP